MEQYPHIRIFEGSDKLIYSFAYAYPDKVTQYAQKYIGNGLIEFIEMDFEKYRKLLDEAKTIPLTMENYQTIRNRIYDVAETILDNHRYVGFFLIGLLNNILKTPVHYQSDIEAEHLKQLCFCIEELDHVLELQEVCTEAVTACLDKENRSDKEMSKGLCEFTQEDSGFAEATIKIQYALLPKKKGKVDMDTMNDIHDWNLRETDELLEIMHQEGEGVSLTPYYLMEYLDEMLYFVLYDKRKRDFCDRPYKDNRTCGQVGAKLFFEKGVEADPYLTAFTVEYNKVYSRRYRAYGKAPQELRGKDMSAEDFVRWSKLAQQARSDYLEGKLSGEDMIQAISVN